MSNNGVEKKQKDGTLGMGTKLGQGENTRVYLSITDALRLLPNLQTMTGKDKRRANVRDLRDSRRVRLLAEGSGVTRVQEAYEMRMED